jgi:putative mRNA 3-end processing factor
MKISAESSGVILEVDNKTIALDADKPADINFVSHAHADHVPKNVREILCSEETAQIIRSRYNRKISVVQNNSFEFIPSGHILGSTSLLINSSEGRILYTGDFCTRDRFFIKGFKPPKAEVLVLETTFGNPRYIFPSIREVKRSALDWVEDQTKRGYNIIAKGYSLGKAQLLCSLFERLDIPVYVHGAVSKMNAVYSDLGIDLRGFIPYREAKEKGYLKKSPWLLVSPVAMKLPSKTAFFSGWAVDSGFKYSRGLDEAFPLSDHSDFDELLSTVKQVNPRIIFTTHGFSKEFAETLKSQGFRAIPLTAHQMQLADFS